MEHDLAMPPETRIIEVGAPDQAVASGLAQQGLHRYLGLVEPERLSAVRASGALADRVLALTSLDVIERSGADLLILRGRFGRLLWSVDRLAGFRFVAVEHGRTASALEGRSAGLIGRLTNDLAGLGRRAWGGTTFELFEVRATRERQPRIFSSPTWGVEGLAERLADAGLNYVVMRWFESLPEIEPGEDLDILVADDDLEAFRALVESEPGTVPIDLYSVSGLPYSDYQDAAYYPPTLAAAMLESSIVHESGYRVPSPLDHLHSLAYHAIYQKGARAGIQSERLGHPVADPEHDYAATLSALANDVGVALPTTFEGIHSYLGSVGWQPTPDAMRRLSSSNDWIESLIPSQPEGLPGRQPEESPGRTQITVFLVRRATAEVVPIEEVLGLLDHFGFDVLHHERLDADATRRAAQHLRGGNWGKGPFPRSGGDPAELIVALHYAPSEPYPWLHERYPHLTNAEIYEVKAGLRGLIESRVSAHKRFNPVHSSDNSGEAWEYLDVIAPERVADLRLEAERRADANAAPDAVIRTLSRGRRARVDLVDAAGGPLVKKTFVPAFARFLDREVAARRDLAGIVPEISALVDSGPTWFTMRYHDSAVEPFDSARLLPLPLLRRMIDVLRRLHHLGYDVVDAKPGNFVLDAHEGLKLVDLEFLHRYEGDTPPFEHSMNFTSPPPEFTGDRPVGSMDYDSRWLPYTGLPLSALLQASPGRQRVARALLAVRRATVLPGSPGRWVLSRARGVARRAKRFVVARLRAWADGRTSIQLGALKTTDD